MYAEAKRYFDVNGNRNIYTKFRDPASKERVLYQVVHYFISLHIPQAQQPSGLVGVSSALPLPKAKRSNLKQKEYEIHLKETVNEKDYFSTEITRAQIKKRKEHLERYLTSNGEKVSPSKRSSSSGADSEMKDEQVLDMAFPKHLQQ